MERLCLERTYVFLLGVIVTSTISGSFSFLMRNRRIFIHTVDGRTLRMTQFEDIIDVSLQGDKEGKAWRIVEANTSDSWGGQSPSNVSDILQQIQAEQNVWNWGKAGALALSALVAFAVTAAGFVLLLRSGNSSISWKFVRQGCGPVAYDNSEDQELLSTMKTDPGNDVV